MSRMPTEYKSFGLPFHWQSEASGELYAAVYAYLDYRIDNRPFTAAQFALVRDYMIHYVNAPCWNNDEFKAELIDIRQTAARLLGPDDIPALIHKCMDIGLDPL